MSRLIILRGNSGSGKTSVAKALQQKFGSGTMLISHDVVRMEFLNVRGEEGIVKSEKLMINLLKYGKDNSKITIIEGILPSNDYEKLFDVARSEFGENIFAYYYDLPFEETLIRHYTKSNCNDFGEAEMKRWWKDKDYLATISEVTLDKNLSLEDAIELIYRQVSANE